MTYYKATYSFESLPHLEKAAFADNHATRITGHAVFTSPIYTGVQVEAKAADVIEKYEAYTLNHGDDEYDALTQSSIELSGMLKANADYVSAKAAGDKLLIESAGFVATRDKTPPIKPEYSAKHGEEAGKIDCYYNMAKEDESVVWACYTNRPEGEVPRYDEVTLSGTTAKRHTITGLKSGSYYMVFVANIARKEAGTLNFIFVGIVLVV